MPQVFAVPLCEAVAFQPVPETVPTVTVTPVDALKLIAVVELVYDTWSAKYDSCAVTRLRRSDFIAAMYAFSFVFANFGIAMAAKMPMITTTIRSSISVKPLVFLTAFLLASDVILPCGEHSAGVTI